MSGIVGILQLDGRPVERDHLARMTDAMAHRGPDKAGTWAAGAVGLGHRMLGTTPEAGLETQPLLDRESQLCLALDGRVDNREELRSALAAKGIGLRDDSDGELVLRSYECWGNACVEHILGDWAFILWDPRERRLFFARDPAGIRPLMYWSNQDVAIVASDPEAIFAHPAPVRGVNWPVLGDQLCDNWSEHEETLYAGVRRLLGGHGATLERGVFKTWRYWPTDFGREIRYRAVEEYSEHFRHLFDEAVRSRLRGNGLVGVLLSGGLDSSSIACGAQALLNEKRGALPSIETLSLVYPGLECDESHYIDAVASELVIPTHRIEYEEYLEETLLGNARNYPGVRFDPAVMATLLGPARRAKERGIRVLLTGIGGDELFAGFPWWSLPDTLRTGDLRRFCQQFRNARSWESIWSLLLRRSLWPLLPFDLRRRVHRLRDRLFPREIALWIEPEFATRWKLRERLVRRAQRAVSGPKTVAKELLCNLFTASYNMVFALEALDQIMSRQGLESRHPFFDRRLLDFALAIPEQVRCGDISKTLLRGAMRDALPARIRQRRSKAAFDCLLRDQIENRQSAAVDALFKNLRLVAAGVLKAGEPERLLRAFRRGDVQQARPVRWILSSELWLRHAIPQT